MHSKDLWFLSVVIWDSGNFKIFSPLISVLQKLKRWFQSLGLDDGGRGLDSDSGEEESEAISWAI